MINVFVSCPMYGYKDGHIIKVFESVKKWLSLYLKDDFRILDSYINETSKNCDALAPVVYLSKSIEKLAKADLAVFTPGWKEARGCKIEHRIASDYGIRILELPNLEVV